MSLLAFSMEHNIPEPFLGTASYPTLAYAEVETPSRQDKHCSISHTPLASITFRRPQHSQGSGNMR